MDFSIWIYVFGFSRCNGLIKWHPQNHDLNFYIHIQCTILFMTYFYEINEFWIPYLSRFFFLFFYQLEQVWRIFFVIIVFVTNDLIGYQIGKNSEFVCRQNMWWAGQIQCASYGKFTSNLYLENQWPKLIKSWKTYI